MKESVLNRLKKCSNPNCGEYFYSYPGVSDSRCESCWEDKEETPEEVRQLKQDWEEGRLTA